MSKGCLGKCTISKADETIQNRLEIVQRADSTALKSKLGLTS